MGNSVQGPLWDWIKKKTKNRDSLLQAKRIWPTEESIGATYRTMPYWDDAQKAKFNAMIQTLNLPDEE